MFKIIPLALLIGLIEAILVSTILFPILLKKHANQRLSEYLEDKHQNKKNTPTMGGIIFIIPPIISIIVLLLLKKIYFSYNLLIVVLTFFLYSLIGFIDDYLIIKYQNNKGLSEQSKFFMQIILAIFFLFLFLKSGNEPLLWIHFLNLKINIGFLYGFLILLILVSSSNAVNITDGLDGLAGGLSIIALITFAFITLKTGWLDGYLEIAIFMFILIGSLIGFMFFNLYPAKIFMGDTGSLALGAAMGAIAILTHRELTLLVVAFVFVIETLSVILQVIWVQVFKKKMFLMTPLHHHFEKLGYAETDIVKGFWVIGLLLAMAGILFGVWL